MAFENLKINDEKAKKTNIEDMAKRFKKLEDKLIRNDLELEKAYNDYEKLLDLIDGTSNEYNNFKDDILKIRKDINDKLNLNKNVLSTLEDKRINFMMELESKETILKNVSALSKDNNKSFKMLLYFNFLTMPFQIYLFIKLIVHI